jgi:hypothetical protein
MRDSELEKLLHDRLIDYQEEPHDSVWNKTAHKLSTSKTLQQKLELYEELPNEFLWKKIGSSLKANTNARRMEGVTALAMLIVLFLLLLPSIWRSEMPACPKVLAPLNSLDQNKSESLPIAENKKQSDLTKTNGITEKANLNQLETNRSNLERKDNWNLIFTTSGTVNSVPTPDNATNLNQKIAYLTPVDFDSIRFLDSVRIKPDKTITKNSDNELALEVERKINKDYSSGSIYLLAMPTLGYQQLVPNKNDGIIIESYEKISTLNSSRLGIRLEAGWCKPINKRLSLLMGILYYQRKQTFRFLFSDTTQWELMGKDEEPFAYESKPLLQPAVFEYNLKNIGIFTGLTYTFNKKRVTQSFGMVMELHQNLQNHELYLFADWRYRLIYPIKSRLAFIAQPSFNYALQLNESLEAPFYVRPYGIGLNLGVQYHLDN